MIFLHGIMNRLMENYILYLVDASRSNVNKFDLHAFTHKQLPFFDMHIFYFYYNAYKIYQNCLVIRIR